MLKLILVGCLICSLAILLENCESYPLQFLPTREGYVPVYIRHGDTPLHEINPELAVAFHEAGIRSRQDKSADDQLMLSDGPANSSSSKKSDEKTDTVESDVLDIEKFEQKFGSDSKSKGSDRSKSKNSNESKSKESDESKSSESEESEESSEKSSSDSKQSEPNSSVKYNTPVGSEQPISVPESTSSVSSSFVE